MQNQQPQTEISDIKKTIEIHKTNYQKFLNCVYESVKEKQYFLKRTIIGQIPPASLPKLKLKDLLSEQRSSTNNNEQYSSLSGGKITNAITQFKTTNSSKSKVFKSFITQLDEQQKKINADNMNLLGLEVKKVNYTEKNKKNAKFNQQFFQENLATVENIVTSYPEVKFDPSAIDLQQLQKSPLDLLCRKVSFVNRETLTSGRRPSSTARKTAMSTYANGSKAYIQIRKHRNSSKCNATQKKIVKNISPEYINPIYEARITNYRQFIFKVGYAHDLYVKSLDEDTFNIKFDQKYKAYIGRGNNSNVIKDLIKRRYWWIILEEKSLDANFIWTQLKINEYFTKQQPSTLYRKQKNVDFFDTMSTISPSKKKKGQKIQNQAELHKIFNEFDHKNYIKKMTNYQSKGYNVKKQILNLNEYKPQLNLRVHNHLINNFYIGNKKAMFYCLKQYYQLIGENVFQVLPLTFHIKTGMKDLQYKRFISYYKKRELYIKKQQQNHDDSKAKPKLRNIWIVKPGEVSNRGNGITVIDQIYQLNNILKNTSKHENGTTKTYIVQLYMDRPFLYQRRKFDIRHYILITHLHGIMKGYWFDEGYIRTTSYEFDIQNFDRQVHLTNDAVQKWTSCYGKYQPGNKLSYYQFQRYLDSTYPKKKYNFANNVLPEMKQICVNVIKSSYLKLSPQRLKHNFQIFGLDFMIDNDFKPWLIQINTNPCLQLSSPLLARLIPQMLDQAFRLSIDIIYPPPCQYPNTARHLVPETGLENFKFQLIFDEKVDGIEVRNLYRKVEGGNFLQQIGQISEDEEYQDEGKQLPLDQLLQLS